LLNHDNTCESQSVNQEHVAGEFYHEQYLGVRNAYFETLSVGIVSEGFVSFALGIGGSVASDCPGTLYN